MDTIWLDLTRHSHTALGSIALLGGLVALLTAKGSRRHVLGGKVFAWTMVAVIVTSMLFMFHELLPLAIVLALACAYMIPSAVLNFHREWRGFVPANVALMVLAGLLGAVSLVQFVRLNLVSETLLIGPLVMSILFAYLFVGDWRMLARRPTERNYWIRRHLARMILAFTIAVMALVRIGINFGLSLEMSVILPLAVAAVAIWAVNRRYPLAGEIPVVRTSV